jgi:hypothetical protein
VAGARVRARRSSIRAPDLAEARADGRGHFALEGLDPERTLLVVVEAEGFVPHDLFAEPGHHAADAARREIRLDPGFPFRGRILLEGKPVPGVRLVLPREDRADLEVPVADDGSYAFTGWHIVQDANVQYETPARGISEGRELRSGEPEVVHLVPFRLSEPVEEEKVVETPDLEEVGDAPAPSPAAEPALPVPSECPVTLVVVLEDPTTGGTPWLPILVRDERGMECPLDGPLRFRAPPGRTVTVQSPFHFRHRGFRRVEKPAKTGTADAPAEARILLEPSPRARLRLLLPDGTPFAGPGEVRVRPLAEGAPDGWILQPDAAGTVRIPVDDGLPSTLRVHAEGWSAVAVEVPAVRAGDPEAVVDARFPGPLGLSISGTVTTPLGYAAAGAQAFLVGADGEERGVETGADARFAFEDLGAGEFLLRAEAEGFRPSAPAPVRLDHASNPNATVTLRLRPSARVEVVVLDADGSPRKGVLVQGDRGGAAVTDDRGRALLRVPGASATLRALGPDGAVLGLSEVDLSGPEETVPARIVLGGE